MKIYSNCDDGDEVEVKYLGAIVDLVLGEVQSCSA